MHRPIPWRASGGGPGSETVHRIGPRVLVHLGVWGRRLEHLTLARVSVDLAKCRALGESPGRDCDDIAQLYTGMAAWQGRLIHCFVRRGGGQRCSGQCSDLLR